MIDSVARTKLAQSARWLLAGRITNYQFDDGIPDSHDPVVSEMYNKAFWLLYCDLHEYRMIGNKRIEPKQREIAVRCIMFLKSDLPYLWPILSRTQSAALVVLNLLTLGLAGRMYSNRAARHGDINLWPFYSSEQYSHALRNPKYLTGLCAN